MAASFLPLLKLVRTAAAGAAFWIASMLLDPAGVSLLRAEEGPGLLQPRYFSQEFTVDDGLPHNIINQVVQDAQGYLWMASAAGLVRFDGRHFKEVSLARAADPSYNIRDLVVDPAGGVLLLPGTGGILHWQNGVVTRHPVGETLSGKNSSNLFIERDGTLWIDAEGGELVRWEKGRTDLFHRGREIPAMSGHYTFAADAQGRLWIGTGDYFGYYEKGKLIWSPERIGPNIYLAPARSGGIWLSSSERLVKLEDAVIEEISAGPAWSQAVQSSVQQLLEDREGNLWIGTRRKGLLCFSSRGFESVQGPSDNITSILEDAEDNIWIGTHGGGIRRLRPKSFLTLENGNGTIESARTSLGEDTRGGLWLANRGPFLTRYYNGQIQSYSTHGFGRPPELFLVCPDRLGTIWVATSAGLATISAQHPTELEVRFSALKDVRDLLCARNGDIWAVQGDAGVGYIREGVFHDCAEGNDQIPKRIRVLAEGPQGSIWIGSGERNLLEYSGAKFIERFAGREVPGGTLNALLFDRRGTLWLATTHGLVLKQGAHFKHFGGEEGLTDELISQILEDDRGRIWCANRRGFSAVPVEDFYAVAEGRQSRVTEVSLGKDDGLPKAYALAGIPPRPIKTHEGRLWFATNGGFVGIDPRASLPRPSAPPVYIDEVDVDKQSYNPLSALKLTAGEHQVTFKFTAINFSAPEKVRLRHQLVGYDSEWIDTGTDQTASYVYLPPGNYQMRVTSRSPDGRWNDTGAVLDLRIPPTWWQTWLFRLAASLALATAFGWLVRHWSQRRLRARLIDLEREHQLERERARIARDLHDELGYSVTQIGLIADRLKSDASSSELREGLGDLATHTRRLSGELDGVVWTVSPKNDKWDRLASYIKQFALNFFADTSIACTVEGVEGAPPDPVGPEVQHHLLAIIKESLNNILKHARATRVEISLDFSRSTLNLRISDNGVGFDPAAPEHAERNGLTNLRTRALEIAGKLEIESSREGGTLLKLSVDLTAKPQHVVRCPS